MNLEEMNSMPMDLAAELYQKNGFVLIPLSGKVPTKEGKDWDEAEYVQQKPEFWKKTENKYGFGARLSSSHIVTLDIDSTQEFNEICKNIEDMGLLPKCQVPFWKSNTAAIQSGREGSAKLVFRIQENTLLTYHKLSWHVDDGKGKTKSKCIFELRCGGKKYDVLPPSPYVEKGKKYQWVGGTEILPIPEDLMDLWVNFDKYEPLLKSWSGNKKDVEAYLANRSAPKASITTKSGKKKDLISIWNTDHSVVDCLLEHGYERTSNPKRFISPESSSHRDGVIVNENNTFYVFSESDYFSDGYSHTPFDLILHYEYDDNFKDAKKYVKEEVKTKHPELFTKEEKSEQALPTLEEWGEKHGKRVFKSNGTTSETIDEISACINYTNSFFTEKTADSTSFIAFKNGVGLRQITKNHHTGIFEEHEVPYQTLKNFCSSKSLWFGGKFDPSKDEYENIEPSKDDYITFTNAKNPQGLNIPVYTALSQSAFLCKDGRVVNRFGIDKETNILLTKTLELPEIPDVITTNDVEKAKEVLGKCYSEFLFEKDTFDTWDNTIAYHNTIFMLGVLCFRLGLIGENTPCFAVNKNSEGVGGTLLQLVTTAQAFGTECSIANMTTNVTENEKVIQSIVKESQPATIIDNITSDNWVSPTVLSMLSGSSYIKFRTMRTQDMCSVQKATTLLVNGIRLDLSADITRRCVQISLKTDEGHSWQQTSFKTDNRKLMEMAKDNHPNVIWAMKVLYDFWEQNGKQAPKKLSGNFSEYTELYNLIGGILCPHYPHILDNLKEVQVQNNEFEETLRDLVENLYAIFPNREFTVNDVKNQIVKEQSYFALYDGNSKIDYDKHIGELLFEPNELRLITGINVRSIGKRLSRYIRPSALTEKQLTKLDKHGGAVYKVI